MILVLSWDKTPLNSRRDLQAVFDEALWESNMAMENPLSSKIIWISNWHNSSPRTPSLVGTNHSNQHGKLIRNWLWKEKSMRILRMYMYVYAYSYSIYIYTVYMYKSIADPNSPAKSLTYKAEHAVTNANHPVEPSHEEVLLILLIKTSMEGELPLSHIDLGIDPFGQWHAGALARRRMGWFVEREELSDLWRRGQGGKIQVRKDTCWKYEIWSYDIDKCRLKENELTLYLWYDFFHALQSASFQVPIDFVPFGFWDGDLA